VSGGAAAAASCSSAMAHSSCVLHLFVWLCEAGSHVMDEVKFIYTDLEKVKEIQYFAKIEL
jgi:hypothetical protein